LWKKIFSETAFQAAARSTTIGPEDCGKLAQAEEEIRSSLKPAQFKDEFARFDREEAIQSWLESQNVAEPWKLAPNLAEANLTDADLARFAAAAAAGASVGPELTRFAILVEMDRIAEELETSSARISDLIKAIKEYSYMDQGPMQEVDIERGIETTLTMMQLLVPMPLTQFLENTSGMFAAPGLAGTIGAQMLSRFKLIFDYPHGEMILESHDHLGEPSA